MGPAFAIRSGHPCATIILVATSAKEWPEDIIWRHFCPEIALNRINETIAYMMWRVEHLLYVSVLQRVHISSLVFLGGDLRQAVGLDLFNESMLMFLILLYAIDRLFHSFIPASPWRWLQFQITCSFAYWSVLFWYEGCQSSTSTYSPLMFHDWRQG
jgi:hypothetical protein